MRRQLLVQWKVSQISGSKVIVMERDNALKGTGHESEK